MPPSDRQRRSKIRLACTNCREDKTRCDGTRPVCTRCRKRRGPVTCIYERRGFTARRIISGSESAKRLQGGEPNNRLPENTHDKYTAGPGHNEHAVFTESQPLPEMMYRPISPALSHVKQDIHARDALATVPLGEDTDDALYGGSSTIALLRHVAPGVHSQATPSDSQDFSYVDGSQNSHIRSHSLATYPEITRAKDETAAVYPPRRNANDYVRCYFEFVQPLFPILHKPSFSAKYETLWLVGDSIGPKDDDPTDCVFLSTLNLVFALGCQYSGLVPRAKRSSVADEFYQRSRKLFVFELLDSTSLPLVQLLLLQGAYLQSSRYPTRCWNVVGLAIRAAQSLGLHLDVESKTQLMREMRRRVWHVCVCLDKLLAMTFGRPTMIGKSWNVPIPSLIDDEYLRDDREEGIQPVDVPSRMGLFVSSCTLFEILADILGYFYIDESRDGPPRYFRSEAFNREVLPQVLDFNRRLDDLSKFVPDYLRIEKMDGTAIPDKNSCVNLQQQVLYCRFMYVRVLSLRPLLLLATRREHCPSTRLPEESQSSLDEELIRNCCNLCVVTAHRIIENIHGHLDTAYKSSGWHSVYFTFASITTLLAALQCRYVETEAGNNSFDVSWDNCLSILEHYREQIHSAKQAIHVLQILRSRIFKAETRGGTPVVAINNEQDIPEVSLTSNTASPQIDNSDPFDLSTFNPYGAEFIADAWFGQQITSLDLLFPS